MPKPTLTRTHIHTHVEDHFMKEEEEGLAGASEGFEVSDIKVVFTLTHSYAHARTLTHTVPLPTHLECTHTCTNTSRCPYSSCLRLMKSVGASRPPPCYHLVSPCSVRRIRSVSVASIDLALNVNEPLWWGTKWHCYIKASAIQRGQPGFYVATVDTQWTLRACELASRSQLSLCTISWLSSSLLIFLLIIFFLEHASSVCVFFFPTAVRVHVLGCIYTHTWCIKSIFPGLPTTQLLFFHSTHIM